MLFYIHLPNHQHHQHYHHHHNRHSHYNLNLNLSKNNVTNNDCVRPQGDREKDLGQDR